MKHVVVLNPKGGCGKTTIATHLAVYASTLGLRVALADHDEQASSHDWLKSRPRRCAEIAAIAAYEGAAIDGDFEVVIHDMPATAIFDHASIAEASSKIIIPIMPSPIDLKAAMRLWMKLSNSGWLDDPNIEIGVVANRIKNNSKYEQTLNAFIEKIGLPHITTLRDTQNYIRSLDAGLTLFDMPPNRVADDLIQWQPLMEWTGFFDIEDDELLELFGAQADVQPGADQMVSYEDMQAEQLAEESLGFEQY